MLYFLKVEKVKKAISENKFVPGVIYLAVVCGDRSVELSRAEANQYRDWIQGWGRY